MNVNNLRELKDALLVFGKTNYCPREISKNLISINKLLKDKAEATNAIVEKYKVEETFNYVLINNKLVYSDKGDISINIKPENIDSYSKEIEDLEEEEVDFTPTLLPQGEIDSAIQDKKLNGLVLTIFITYNLCS